MTSRAISREGGGPCRFFRCSREAGNESRLSVYRSRNLSRQQTILLFAHCAVQPHRTRAPWLPSLERHGPGDRGLKPDPEPFGTCDMHVAHVLEGCSKAILICAPCFEADNLLIRVLPPSSRSMKATTSRPSS